MRAKTFALVKESMARGGEAGAVGGAQVAEVFQIPTAAHTRVVGMHKVRVEGGRNLDADGAHRIVAQVSLGKHSVLFRLGHDPKERAGVIDELSIMLKRSRNKGRTVPFSMKVCRLIAAAACDELALDMCPTCWGAGEVRMKGAEIEGRQPMTVCPTCSGAKRRRYTEDERIARLAKAWGGDAKRNAKELRAHKRLHEIIAAIDSAKGMLIESERVAVEEVARMSERW